MTVDLVAVNGRRLRLGTRGSALALAQSGLVASAVASAAGGVPVEISPIVTTGDRRASAVRDKREWVLELESALLNEEIDFAVHSGKDVPAEIADGTELVSVLNREDPSDLLIVPVGRYDLAARTDAPLAALPAGARIGTASLRRAAQLRRSRPDLEPVELRGNVPTRVSKLLDGQADAIIIAAAGINRLRQNSGELLKSGKIDSQQLEVLNSIESVRLPFSCNLPAVCQGILAVQLRCDDHQLKAAIAKISSPAAQAAFLAERAAISALGADCRSAVGVFAEVIAGSDDLVVVATVYSRDGAEMIESRQKGPVNRAAEIGAGLGEDLIRLGARRLLK